MNETNSLREASGGPESFMLQPLKLKRRLLLTVCREYCLYLRISPARAVGWTIMRRDNNNTNINICPHYVSSRELRPVTQSKHREAIVSIISSEDNCHLARVWSPEPGAGCRGQETTWSLVTTCWRGLGPLPPVIALTSYWRYGQLFTLAIIDTRDFGQRSDFVKSDRIKMAIVLAALL